MDPNDHRFDPDSLAAYVGQEELIRQLVPELKASIATNQAICSQVWYGPPGLGKTTLAELLAKCRGVNCIRVQCSGIQQRHLDVIFRAAADPRVGAEGKVDLTGFEGKSDFKSGSVSWKKVGPIRPTILILDEVESLKPAQHQSMQDVTMPPPGGHRIYHTSLGTGKVFCPDVTVVLITNDYDRLVKNGAANVARCRIRHRFNEYSNQQIAKIAHGMAARVGMTLEPGLDERFAALARGVPRSVEQLMAAACSQVHATNHDRRASSNRITTAVFNAAIAALGLDHMGFGPVEREYLCMLQDARDQTLPLESLGVMLNRSEKEIKDTVEPPLMRAGMVERWQGKGRRLTSEGYKYCVRAKYDLGQTTIDTNLFM